MASKYEISAIFKMVDNFSGPLQRAAGSSSAFAKKFSADMRKTEMQIKAAGAAMKKMAGLAVAAGAALAVKTVADGAKAYIEFEDSISKAGAKFKDLDVTSDSYSQTLEELQTAARQVGATTKFSAADSASALEKMAMAGMTSKQSMAMLMGTTNLAAAVGLDLTSAVDMATDAMGAFNLVSDDENEVAENMNRIADVVAKATNMANLDMEMWFESVKMGASTFTSLGGTIEEFSAYAGTLANAGIKGSQAGNNLKNIMLNLSAPAKKGADALNELGISVFDAQGQMLPLTNIMKQFETNLAGVADERKASLLKDIFGKEQISAFNVLLQAGSENLADFTNTLEKSKGTAQTVAEVQANSFSGLIEQLKSAWGDKLLSIGKAFETGGAKDALQGLISYVQNLDITGITNFITDVVKSLPVIAEKIGNVMKFLWDMKEVIGALIIAWGIYKGALIAALVVEKIQSFITMMQGVTVATNGATAAQYGMNTAMNACPIMLIVTLVMLMASLGKKAWEANEAMTQAFGIDTTQRLTWQWESFWLQLKVGIANAIIWFSELGIKIWDVLGRIPGMGDMADKMKAVYQNTINVQQQKKASYGEDYYNKLAQKGMSRETVNMINDTYANMSLKDNIRGQWDKSVWADKGYNAQPTRTAVDLNMNVNVNSDGNATASVVQRKGAPAVNITRHQSGKF